MDNPKYDVWLFPMHKNGFVHSLLILAILTIWKVPVVLANPGHAQVDSVRNSAIVDKHGCRHCHMIEGSGSVLAPPLDGIGKYRNQDYILGCLKTKASRGNFAYPVPKELMSHIHISETDAKLLVKYLLALPAREVTVKGHGDIADMQPGGSQFIPKVCSESTKRGIRIYKRNNCVACHSVGGVGGHIGPDLAGVGARRSRLYIENTISGGVVLLPRPGQTSRNFAMPPSKLKASDIRDLTDWLLTLPPVN